MQEQNKQTNTPNFDSIVGKVMQFENPEAVAMLLVNLVLERTSNDIKAVVDDSQLII